MRKGFASLSLQVQQILHRDSLSGDLFCFRGRRGDLLKVIWHDGQVACLFSKRLSKGRFVAPWQVPSSRAWTLSELGRFLEGSEYVGRLPLSPDSWRPAQAPSFS